MPIENFCVVRPVLDKNDKPCYNGERIKLADGTFQVVNPKETSMDDVVNGEGEGSSGAMVEAIEEDGDDEVTVENANSCFVHNPQVCVKGGAPLWRRPKGRK